MRTQRNIRLLNSYTQMANMVFVVAILVPFYRDEMGLSFRDFLIGEAAFAAVVVLLEVPSGWLSDMWQRKHVLALGLLFDLAGLSLLVFGDSLAWAISAQVIIGIGISLISGTNTAMMYDTLLDLGRSDDFRRLEGRRAGLGFYSVAGASFLSGWLYGLHHYLPIVLTIIAASIGVVLACMMVEPERHRRQPEKHPLRDMAETARYALHGHAEIGLIILCAAVLFCATKMIMWVQQPYYMALQLHESLFGILMSAGFLMAGLSSQLGHRLDGRIGSIKALGIAWLVAMIACMGASLHLGWSGIALLMISGSGLYGMAAPRVSDTINKRVGSERRATILSTQSLMVNLLFMPLSFLIGWISDGYGVSGALLGIAGWLSLAGLCLLFIITRKGRRQMMML